MGCCPSLFGFSKMEESEPLAVVTFDSSCAGPKVQKCEGSGAWFVGGVS